MPVYIYQNPKTKEVVELVQSINDAHDYTDESGLKCNRM